LVGADAEAAGIEGRLLEGTDAVRLTVGFPTGRLRGVTSELSMTLGGGWGRGVAAGTFEAAGTGVDSTTEATGLELLMALGSVRNRLIELIAVPATIKTPNSQNI